MLLQVATAARRLLVKGSTMRAMGTRVPTCGARPRAARADAGGIARRGARWCPARLNPQQRLDNQDGQARVQRLATSASRSQTPSSVDGARNDSVLREGFSQLGVESHFVRRLLASGIAQPSAVQQRTIPTLLSGACAAIESYTGSGKTLAYLLPIMQRLGPVESDERRGRVRAVVVAPSQELAMQICRVGQALASSRYDVQQLIGGANKRRQVASLKAHKPRVVVGTPGRLAELSREGILQTHGAECLVLDEVDKLLAANFQEDLDRLLSHFGRKARRSGAEVGEGGALGGQRVLVSATLTEAITSKCVSRGWIDADHEAIRVGVGASPDDDSDAENAAAPPALTLSPQISHGFVVSPRGRAGKVDTIRRFIHAWDAEKVIVFHNHRRELKETAAKLHSPDVPVVVLDGQASKQDKRNAIDRFLSGRARVLLASEAATRGLDFPGCDAVVNLEMPMDAQHYVHRAGRTGRGGDQGVVVSVPAQSEVFIVKRFAKQLGVDIGEYIVRGGRVLPKE